MVTFNTEIHTKLISQREKYRVLQLQYFYYTLNLLKIGVYRKNHDP